MLLEYVINFAIRMNQTDSLLDAFRQFYRFFLFPWLSMLQDPAIWFGNILDKQE